MTPLQIAITIVVGALVLTTITAITCALRCTAGPIIWVYSMIVRFYMRIMSSWKSNRPCNWPQDGEAIIIANHVSPVDPILLWHRYSADRPEWPGRVQRVIGFMVAKEYVTPKNLVGWICRTMQSIPVNRSGQDTEAVRTAIRRLRAGKWLGVFPEGYINTEPETGLKPFNTGVAFLALKTGTPVYPVFIHGSPRSSGMVACFFKRSKVRVTYGDPIDLRDLFGDARKPSAETLEKATQYLHTTLQELGNDRWFQ